MAAVRVFKANIIHSLSLDKLQVLQGGLLGVNAQGCVEFLCSAEDAPKELETRNIAADRVLDLGSRMLLPGFVDTHAHAPQYSYTGTGYDLTLLKWLNTYTFPKEAKFKDLAYARDVYEKCVRRHLRNGSTTMCYFATIHLEASKLLCDIVAAAGQRALVGKVNMDRNSPDYYIEDVDVSLRDTEAFVEHVAAMNNALVQPIVTPRFVPTCTVPLMRGLADIAERYGARIQSHIDENLDEVAWVRELHPECTSYADVYARYGLLTDRTVMAHCVYMTDEELALFAERGVGVAHCPASNFNLRSGVANVRRMLRAGVDKIGLGTDVSGGHSPSLLHAMQMAITASNVINVQEGDAAYSLTLPEAFYLATLGGARVLGMEQDVGNFAVGKQFDALVVDAAATDSPFDVFDGDTLEDVFSKFVYLGGPANISHIFVAGKRVHGDALK